MCVATVHQVQDPDPDRRDRAKSAALWPDPSANGRKRAENPGSRPVRHRGENPVNKVNSGLASA